MASELRRRDVGKKTRRSSIPREESPIKVEEKVKVVHQKPKTRKRRNTAIFFLGSIAGIIAAGLFAKSNDLIDFPEIGELSMDSLFDVLPAGLVKDMSDLVVSRKRTICIIKYAPDLGQR
jgi:phospholipid:diacylglycerol acyltransferase